MDYLTLVGWRLVEFVNDAGEHVSYFEIHGTCDFSNPTNSVGQCCLIVRTRDEKIRATVEKCKPGQRVKVYWSRQGTNRISEIQTV